MDYSSIGRKVRGYYDHERSKLYRKHDEDAVMGDEHKRTSKILKDISGSFNHKITVLDLGCGTGRFFHSLNNVERLVGVDVSPDMLREARNPVEIKDIKIKHIDLVCANILEFQFPDKTFDFIYSNGVLGEYSPFNEDVCEKLYLMLKSGGKLFFTVVDFSTKKQSRKLKRRFVEGIYPVMPSGVKKKLDVKLKGFFMTRPELEKIMEESRFKRFKIDYHYIDIPTWKGAHLECTAIRAE